MNKDLIQQGYELVNQLYDGVVAQQDAIAELRKAVEKYQEFLEEAAKAWEANVLGGNYAKEELEAMNGGQDE